jgi:hypothetical protein
MLTISEAAMRSAWVLCLLAVGCGAKFESTGDGGVIIGDDVSEAGVDGGSDGAAGDGGSNDGGWSPVCPASLPATGSACAQSGASCEYGTSVLTSCNAIVECRQGTWQTATYPGPACPTGPNPQPCAQTFSGVPRGAVCGPEGTECVYTQGACTCEPPVFGPPQPLDGGPTTTWHCTDAPPGCPAIRPRLGTACSTPNMDCMYVECAFSETCSMGVWQAQPVACANGGGGTR